MPVVSYNPGDNFYDPYGDPWNTDPGGNLSNRWWLNPAWITGGMNPPNFGTSGPGGGPPQQPPSQPPPAEPPMPEPQPPQSNEGQTTETPEGTPPSNPEGEVPNFPTDVYGDTWKLPLGGVALGAGLGGALAGLAGSGSGASTGGGTTPNYETTGWEVGDFPQAPLTPGGVTPPGTVPNFETTGWDVGDWGSPGGTSFQTGPFNSPLVPGGTSFQTGPLVSTPGGGGGGFPVSLFPWLDKLPGLITGGGGGGGGGQQQPQQPSQPGQQGQQGSQTGKLLAALPMLAAFQGGTTTTPAPYAHLGPHTPVKPVFGPQGPGKPIPSIGQLLAGFNPRS